MVRANGVRFLAGSMLFVMLASLSLSSCDWSTEEPGNGDGSSGEQAVQFSPGKVNPFFRGIWDRMDINQQWTFEPNRIIAPKGAAWGDRGITEYGDTLLEIQHFWNYDNYRYRIYKTDSDSLLKVDFAFWNDFRGNNRYETFYLFRRQSTSFKGRIIKQDPSSTKSLVGISGINVIIKSILDLETTRTFRTGSDGGFTASGVFLDETYVVSTATENAVELRITPVINDHQSGLINKTRSRYNFKAWAICDKYMYQGRINSVRISIQNIGTEDCTATVYQLVVPPNLRLISNNDKGLLMTIEPGASKYIDIQVEEIEFEEYFVDEAIELVLKDIDGNVWTDLVPLRFYREPYPIRFSSYDNPVSFTLICEHGQRNWATTSSAVQAGYSYFNTIDVPLGLRYIIAVSGATANGESRYSICAGDYPSLDASLSVFLNTGVYEHNDRIEEAVSFSTVDVLESYIHKSDIDFFEIALISSARR